VIDDEVRLLHDTELLTDRDDRVPIDVMLGWVGVCIVPVMLVARTLDTVTELVIIKFDRVPIEVILGCDPV
jgi:hypothetical protein